ncbi:MAG: FKBP-type peptidyl-prolyl cis-trans isomerase [Polyangiaceae bacterium]|nr:FKBP-type peptidyl-prolyl cis-trans isomerase [Polyangiaceae bacterium]
MSTPSNVQLGPGVVASLRYAVFDEDGECVMEAGEPTEHVIGYGQLWPVLEHAVEGLEVGARKTVTMKPKDAFGERDPKALVEVDRADFPEDVAPGDRFEAEDETGAQVLLKVLDVGDDFVVLDQNHPLAGQKLRVELEVVAARVASEQELRRAEAALVPEEPLISPERLRKGPGRRYEETPEPSADEPPGDE